MPVNQLSTEATRERISLQALPPINALHVWWARRPLAPSRASVLLSLLPESSDSPETREAVFSLLGTGADIHIIAKRLADAAADGQRDNEGYGENRRAFNHTPPPSELNWLNLRIATKDPVILDLTAGGGSIPFEASRLGFHTIANEP